MSQDVNALRKKAEFHNDGVSEEIGQLRYENHCIRVKEAIKSIYYLREEIST